ncbi:MAG TPA: hypothetical protein VM557_14550 [Thermoanaerobaculia bacterium]|nr:hypothetical protein [Thermoanaerobaculia bacterium]
MKTVRIKMCTGLLIVLLAGLTLSCQEVANTSSPVELLVTISETLHVLDFADPNCGSLGVITFRNLIKRPDIVTDPRFLDVRLTAYRVSYERTDGGTQVPAPFTRSLSLLIPAGGAATELSTFIGFEPGVFNQAPFVALLPANGGKDPETGKHTVEMDLVVDFFGETLSGEDVSARARQRLTFCIACGGCR